MIEDITKATSAEHPSGLAARSLHTFRRRFQLDTICRTQFLDKGIQIIKGKGMHRFLCPDHQAQKSAKLVFDILFTISQPVSCFLV